MSFSHEINIFQSMKVSAERSAVEQYLSTPEHMKQCMPKLDELKVLDEDKYYVRYQPMGPEGYKFPFSFSTQAEQREEAIHYLPVKDGENNAVINGKWIFTETAGETYISLNMDVTLQVPVSRLLKPVAGPIIAKIFTNLIQKYMDNISSELSCA